MTAKLLQYLTHVGNGRQSQLQPSVHVDVYMYNHLNTVHR